MKANSNRKYDKFLGINNVDDPSLLVKRDRTGTVVRLVQAENVDLHKDYHLSRANGFVLSLPGNYRSLWSDDDVCLAVLDGDLVQIQTDLSVRTLLENVGSEDMDFAVVYDGLYKRVYFTNSLVIGRVRNGEAALLADVAQEFKQALSAGNIIRYFLGSLYVIKGKTLYISDVINKDIYDERWGWKQFDSDVTMFEDVDDGFYVSDSQKVYFMKREGVQDSEVVATPRFSLLEVDDSPAIPGTAVRTLKLDTPGAKEFNKAICWRTPAGFRVGGPGGSVEKILDGVYIPEYAQTGTGIIREVNGLKQYISIVR